MARTFGSLAARDMNSKTKMENQLCILNNKKNKLVDLTLDGLLTKEELKEKKTVIEKQILNIQKKLKEYEQNRKILKKQEEHQNLKKNVLKELEISKENIEEYIDNLVDKVIIQEDKSNVKFKIILSDI